VFFKSSNKIGLQIKVASYAKIPYASNKPYFSKSNYGPHKNLYNTVHYIKQGHYVTYFYSKKNTLNYYRKSNNDSIVLMQDTQYGTYQIFKLKLDKYDIDAENTLLIKTENGKYYVAIKETEDGKYYIDADAKGKHIVVFNLSNSKSIYTLDVSNTLYCNYFYPIANLIIPIIQVTKDSVSITLCNISNEEVYTILWSLEDINELVMNIINMAIEHNKIRYKRENYKFNEILYFKLDNISYMYDTHDHKILYLKGVKISININTLYFNIKVELNNRNIICCLDMQNAYIKVDDETKLLYKDFFQNLDFFIKEYQFDGKVRDNNLSCFLYDTDCYYVRKDNCGLTYFKKGEYYGDICKTSAVYTYKNYWIIINHWQSYRSRKLAIIDTKRNLMSVWATRETAYCIQSYIVFYFYPTRSNNLIFLSTDLDCIFIIDERKIEQIFDIKEQSECKKEGYRDLAEIVECYNVDTLLRRAVSRAYKIAYEPNDIKLITHYMDKKSDKLYIIARYRLDYAIHTGLFVLRISDDNVNLVLLYDKNEKGRCIEFNKFEDRRRYIYAIQKMNFYRIKDKYSTALDLMCGYGPGSMYKYGYITSIKYNRKSLNFKEFERGDFYYGSAEYSGGVFDHNSENLLVIGYWASDKHNKLPRDYSKFCLILTELCVTRKIQFINI